MNPMDLVEVELVPIRGGGAMLVVYNPEEEEEVKHWFYTWEGFCTAV